MYDVMPTTIQVTLRSRCSLDFQKDMILFRRIKSPHSPESHQSSLFLTSNKIWYCSVGLTLDFNICLKKLNVFLFVFCHCRSGSHGIALIRFFFVPLTEVLYSRLIRIIQIKTMKTFNTTIVNLFHHWIKKTTQRKQLVRPNKYKNISLFCNSLTPLDLICFYKRILLM